MAACGASDSVIAQTPVSPRSRGSLFFSSLFLLHGGGFCSTDSCFYSQHNIIHSALPQSPEDCRGVDALARPDVMRMERNGRRGAPLESLFPFQSRASVLTTSPQNGRERGPFISISHALIYISYIYLHTLLFCSGRGKDNSAKHVLVEAWLHISFFRSLPFMVSAKHSGLKTRRKVWRPLPPSPPMSFKSNQVNEDVSFYMNDWISEGLVYVCFSGLNYFIFFRARSLSFRRVWSVSMLFFLSRKGLSST